MIDFIDRVLEPSSWLLADWSLRWAILIGVLAVWLVVVRPRRSATRYLLCLLVLVAGLVLPALPRWGTEFAIPSAKSDLGTIPADRPTVQAENARLPEPERLASPQELAADSSATDVTILDQGSLMPRPKASELQPAGEAWRNRRITIVSLAIPLVSRCWIPVRAPAGWLAALGANAAGGCPGPG